MNHQDIDSLERATLDAVAPQALEELPGWLLPFDRSSVNRAISAVPLSHSGFHAEVVAEIAARYASKGLGTQFRIADVPGLERLQAALAQQGYRAHHPTLTMTARLRQLAALPALTVLPALALAASNGRVSISQQPSKEWESVYLATEFDPKAAASRVQALSRSNCTSYAWIGDASGALAAGTASMSRGWASFHGLRTLHRVRRQGLAQALLAALCQQALAAQLENCFLQVEEDNTPAITLYQRLGFQTAWRYRYWI